MDDLYFDFAGWELWNQTLNWFLIIVGIGSAIIAYFSKIDGLKSNFVPAIVVFFILFLLLGFYPIEWGYSTDRERYAMKFLNYQDGISVIDWHDTEVGYNILMSLTSRILNVVQYFLLISLIYFCNYFIAFWRLCKANIYWILAVTILSMGFTSYCTNTVRAGLALSFIVLGLSYYRSTLKLLICLFIAFNFHTSSIIPSCMILIARFYNNPNLYLILWFLSIPVSFFAGDAFNNLFSTFSEDKRTEYLTTGADDTVYNVGFRIDFILYSLAPVLIGTYYIFKKNITSEFYSWIYNSYLLTNIFWILVIKANYSDRFAYLSWVLIPIVLTYPLFTQRMNINNGKWIAAILFMETMFKVIQGIAD